jgi:NAD(P)-dependent dehydrogenase (short-subunit alcohol dehydrogenase family)
VEHDISTTSQQENQHMPLALLTGGGSMIGEGIACNLVAGGWTVAVTDINPDLARAVAAKAGGAPRTEALTLDVTDAGQVTTTIHDLIARHGAIDALVNAAGGMRGLGIAKTDFADMTPAIWDRIIDVNFQGVLRCTHAVLPAMIAARRGAVVSIAASRGLRGGPQASIYSAAKAAIIVFSQSLAQEVGRYGIRVNTIAPGNAQARWKQVDPSDGRSPLGRATSGDDVGRAVAFLLSQDAAHITGACLDVSGGTTLH